MSEEFKQVVSTLERLCGTMDNNNKTMNNTMESVTTYRQSVTDDVQAGANAMNKSAEAMITAMHALDSMSTRHSKDIEKLGDKIDSHTGAVTEVLTTLATIVSEQKGMCDGISRLLDKSDAYDRRITKQNSTISDQNTRLAVIESSRTEIKENTQMTKGNIISIITVIAVCITVFLGFMSYTKPPNPPPPRHTITN